MTTIVNNPIPVSGARSNGGGVGFLIGTLIFVGFLAVLLFFGIPALKNLGPLEVNVPAPQVNVAAPQVVVPDKVEVVPAK